MTCCRNCYCYDAVGKDARSNLTPRRTAWHRQRSNQHDGAIYNPMLPDKLFLFLNRLLFTHADRPRCGFLLAVLPACRSNRSTINGYSRVSWHIGLTDKIQVKNYSREPEKSSELVRSPELRGHSFKRRLKKWKRY